MVPGLVLITEFTEWAGILAAVMLTYGVVICLLWPTPMLDDRMFVSKSTTLEVFWDKSTDLKYEKS